MNKSFDNFLIWAWTAVLVCILVVVAGVVLYVTATVNPALALLFGFILIVPFYLDARNKQKRGKARQARQEEADEIRRHSTPIPSWEGSKAALIERPNRPLEISMTVPSSASFCSHLVKLSSLMVKCPKCQHTFQRFFSASTKATLPSSEYSKLKSGELSMTEIIRRQIRKNGCPSTFRCPKCNTTIARSREPSGMCQLHDKRVYGEKLFCCTINQCIEGQ